MKDKNNTIKLSKKSKLGLDWIWKKSGNMKEGMKRFSKKTDKDHRIKVRCFKADIIAMEIIISVFL